MMKKSILALALVLIAQSGAASDVEEVTAMLHDFLANSDTRAAHERFWADDLVYSSSAGLRFGKADILKGFDTPDDEEAAGDDEKDADEEPARVYSGEEVDVRLYGDAAVVAFKLVGTPTNEAAGADVLYYYNTGTFLRRDGVWQVVAWQATKIPPQ
ncbi:MAG: nuclear transport factor 2 family protein [Gammaproteobacteria bacterium]|nr:nuclear transport factor 2 family protein [Gammaproteobacteria bacterium]